MRAAHSPGPLLKGKKGLVREAHGGTLFLDEIGDMPLSSQTRLLRVLAEREITPIGALKPTAVDMRVIAATHCDLLGLVKSGKFREDLYFRLNGATITLPPLRERQDLSWMVAQLLEKRPFSGCGPALYFTAGARRVGCVCLARQYPRVGQRH